MTVQWTAGSEHFGWSEVEERIARHDFHDLTKEQVATPALMLDEEPFEKNLRTMAAHNKISGVKLRPHAKVHKSPEIVKRQIALGAVGVCCATTAECELMVNSGIHGVLHTSQPAGRNQLSREVALARQDPTFMGVLDNPTTVDLLEEALAVTHTKMSVVVDVFAGLEREGCQPGESALHLAQRIDRSKYLKLAGIMGFSPSGHTHGWATRKKRCCDDLAPVIETVDLCRRSGLPIELITGGSTGTYDIDPEYRLTESQAGSYVFMDVRYRGIGSKADESLYTDFDPSLTVLTTVISKTRPNRCTLDYGIKAMLNVRDEIKEGVNARIEPAGAEHGMLVWKHGQHDISLGERLEIYPWIADTTVSAFDRIYVTRGETIVDVWPIMGRGGAPQR